MRYILITLTLLFILSCAGSKSQADWTAEDYFKEAKELYFDEDYFESANAFTVILIRFAGSNVADSAQYFLGLSHFYMGDYLIAAAEFEKLVNDMNQSPLAPKAQYMLGESYYQMSPRAALDQENTLNSIREFQYFLEDNPTDSLKEDAEKKIFELRDKLAEKEWRNAEIYRKMSEYEAAIIYYEQVLAKYYDTSWADDALLGKINTLNDSENFQLALLEITKFEEQFPHSDLLENIKELKKQLSREEEIAKDES